METATETGNEEKEGRGAETGAGREVCVVLVTAPDGEEGARLGHQLVQERLAACVSLVPGVRSLYRWEGEIQDDAEVLLIVKTRADRVAELATRIGELHPYDLPEAVALPAVGGSPAYLAWVASEASR